MKFNSVMKFPFQANYLNFTTTTGPNGLEYAYTFEQIIKFTGGINGAAGGGRMTIYTRNPLRVNARLDYIKDQHGNMVMPWEVQPQGVTYQVMSTAPVLNAFGEVEFYRSNLNVV